MARLAYAYASTAEVRLGPLLERSGLTRQQIQDRSTPLSVSDQISFVNQVAEALGDDLLGFHLARHYDLREIGWYYYVIASSENFLQALQRGARCSALVNEGLSQRAIDGREIGLRSRHAGVTRHSDRHQIEFWTTSLVRMSRQLTGVRIVPRHIALVHLRHRGAAEFVRFLGCDIKFGAPVDEVMFAGRLRDVPLLHSDPYLNRLLVSYCRETLARRGGRRHSTRTQVENAIVPLLPHGNARVAEVARQLGMSQRSLSRRLAQEGSNFSTLLNELRLALARRYLVEEGLAVSQIAWLLGYQDVAAFSNAFKRWTGTTPSEARSTLRK
jgi:AraC-like DNA-binding protein